MHWLTLCKHIIQTPPSKLTISLTTIILSGALFVHYRCKEENNLRKPAEMNAMICECFQIANHLLYGTDLLTYKPSSRPYSRLWVLSSLFFLSAWSVMQTANCFHKESFYSGQMITRFLRWKMDAHVIVTRWKRLTVSMFVVGGFSSWMLPFAFCEKNATEQAACAACELTEKHKLYNWLVLSVVLVLLVLLLMLVGFLCHRLWPRDPSRLSRVVRRYEHPGQGVLSDLTQVSSQSSSW